MSFSPVAPGDVLLRSGWKCFASQPSASKSSFVETTRSGDFKLHFPICVVLRKDGEISTILKKVVGEAD